MLQNKKAFTLIELIIVMSIIGILAVIAVIAISTKAGDARDVRRKADLSAIQTAYAVASAEGHGTDPVADDAPSGGASVALPVVSAGYDPTDSNGNILMDMSNVKDPDKNRQGDACADNNSDSTLRDTCYDAGDYTFLEIGPAGDVGTFGNYKIGASLEDASVSNPDFIYITPTVFIQ